MRPLLSVAPKISLIGVADVRILIAALSFPCGRKGWGAMHYEPVLMHHFPCPAQCQAIPYFELIADGGDGGKIQYCAHVHQAVNLLFLVICMLMMFNRDGGLR